MGKGILPLLQNAKLVNYIQENFAKDRLTDKQFAEKATADLGFHVAVSSVMLRRTALGIRATYNIGAKSDKPALSTRVRDLEDRLATLEWQIAALSGKHKT
jgi:hypothetical protein